MTAPTPETPPVEVPPVETPPAETPPPPEGDPKTFNEDYVKGLRAEAAKYRTEAKANADAAARLKEIEEANQSELEKAINKARQEGASEASKTANSRLVQAELRALAAEQRFRDPRDAIAQLRDSLDGFQVADDGSVDNDALKSALAELAERKPYLLLGDEKPPTPKPDPGQGPRQDPAPTDDYPAGWLPVRRQPS